MPSEEPAKVTEVPGPPSPLGRRRYLRWGIAILIVAAAIAGIVWLRGAPLQTIDRSTLAQASRLWNAADIKHYVMVVELEGRLSHQIELTVEHGVLTTAKRDGQSLPSNRLPRAWTVDGMFDTLTADVVISENAERGEASGRYLKMLGRFDEQLGLPVRYLRIEMVKQGGNPAAGWEIISFERRELTDGHAGTGVADLGLRSDARTSDPINNE